MQLYGIIGDPVHIGTFCPGGVSVRELDECRGALTFWTPPPAPKRGGGRRPTVVDDPPEPDEAYHGVLEDGDADPESEVEPVESDADD
eukprot:1631645-Pyramimonas_sp.AAC.1